MNKSGEDNQRLARGLTALSLAYLFSGTLTASLVYPPAECEEEADNENVEDTCS